MLYRFESDVRLLNALSKHGFRHAPDRVCHEHAYSSQASQAGQANSVTCLRVAMSPIAMLRDFDVSTSSKAMLEAKSFAVVSALSNAVAEHISNVI